jgi:hypothetical protein
LEKVFDNSIKVVLAFWACVPVAVTRYDLHTRWPTGISAVPRSVWHCVEKLERNHDRTASVIEVRVEDIDRLGRKVEQ